MLAPGRVVAVGGRRHGHVPGAARAERARHVLHAGAALRSSRMRCPAFCRCSEARIAQTVSPIEQSGFRTGQGQVQGQGQAKSREPQDNTASSTAMGRGTTASATQPLTLTLTLVADAPAPGGRPSAVPASPPPIAARSAGTTRGCPGILRCNVPGFSVRTTTTNTSGSTGRTSASSSIGNGEHAAGKSAAAEEAQFDSSSSPL